MYFEFTKRLTKISWSLPLLASLFGFCAVVILNFPGISFSDTNFQLEQARLYKAGIQMIDYHPPIMSVMMSFFEPYTDQAKIFFLILHNFMFWIGLYLFSITIFNKNYLKAGLSILVIGFSFPIHSYLGGIIKDTGHVSAFIFSVGLMLYGEKTQKKIFLFFSLITLFYTTIIRLNSFPSIVPIFYIFIYVLTYKKPKFNLKILFPRIAICLLCVMVFLVIGKIFDYKILKVKKGYLEQELFLYDMAGISVQTGKDLIPKRTKNDPNLGIEGIRKIYKPTNVYWMFAVNKWDDILKLSSEVDYNLLLRREWWKAISEHPKQYLKHRLDVLLELFKLRDNAFNYPLAYPFMGYDLTKKTGPLSIKDRVFRKVIQFYNFSFENFSFFFEGWFYFLINTLGFIVGLIYYVKKKYHQQDQYIANSKYELVMILLFLSGLVYSLPYILIGLGNDFRYHYLSIVCTHLALAILISNVKIKDLFNHKLKSVPGN